MWSFAVNGIILAKGQKKNKQMAILGKLIKTGINLSHKFEFPENGDAQEKQLLELLKQAKDTAFGKYFGFEALLLSDHPVRDFQNTVPIHDYNKMNADWWVQQQKFPDITWPGKPPFFALSSGTTGKASKRIPITEAFLDSMKSVGTSMIKSMANFELSESLFESELLMLGSSASLEENELGFKEGEISGINTHNFPGWYDVFYRPGREIADRPNWDDRLKMMVAEAPEWNIGAICGIPSWILILLQEIIKEHKLESIHDIWPNLTLYASGGVAFDTYRSDFEALFSKPVAFLDTYLASEGFFAFTSRPGTMDMELALHHGYFYEFIPFDERGVDDQGGVLENPMTLTAGDVEVGQEYVLVVSSCAGAWRYIIGDVVKITAVEPIQIKITGRTKFYLNVVGSQLSEEKMDVAILEVGRAMNVSINEYSVAAVKNEAGKYTHRWILVSDIDFDVARFAEELDHQLKDANKNYKVARSKALTGIEVRRITKKQYHTYLEKKKKVGGQIKTPKVMSEEKMLDFESTLNL